MPTTTVNPIIEISTSNHKGKIAVEFYNESMDRLKRHLTPVQINGLLNPRQQEEKLKGKSVFHISHYDYERALINGDIMYLAGKMGDGSLSFNERLKKAGVETIVETYKDHLGRDVVAKYLEYKGMRIPRPEVVKVEEICKKHFNLDI